MEKQIAEKYKTILEKEKTEIVGELQKIAAQSKSDPGEWSSKFKTSDSETGHEARETRADEAEEYGEQLPVAKSLAQRLADINLALGKIAGGTYGKCENCDKDIPLERLDANPAARVCFDCDGVPSKL
jgi:RNA polymerase-binding transcription factor DksA